MHERVAGATHNQVRTAIRSGIHETLKPNLSDLAPMTSYSASGREDITEMVALIDARDADGAEAHMRRHLERRRKIANPPRTRH